MTLLLPESYLILLQRRSSNHTFTININQLFSNILKHMPYVHNVTMTIGPILSYPYSGLIENNWSPGLLADLSCPLPDDDSTTRFSVSPEIAGRVMNLTKHKVATLEFLGLDGTRIDCIEDLQVLERAMNDQVVPVPSASRPFPSSNHLYVFPLDDKVYEVYFHRHICTLGFPRSAHIDGKRAFPK